MAERCDEYCDERCQRPEGHTGLCWGNYGTVWREATREETDQFAAEYTAAYGEEVASWLKQ